MDETESADVVTAGQRLREAREAQKLSIDDIAAQTRIPTRHLASLEAGEWDKLPAPTYSIGFAKNYATAVGLDRNEIGEQLRAEMGTGRSTMAHPEIYEAADPARTMPKGLVFGAIALLALVVFALVWINDRDLESDEPVAEASNVIAPAENAVAAAEPVPAAAPAGPVVLTATEAVWLQIKDGATVLKQGELAPGETFEVPASAVAPVLTTGKPEALLIAVGSQQAPSVGQPGRTVSGVSLKAADLLQAGPAPAPGATPQATATTPAAPARTAPRRQAQPAPPPAASPEPGVSTEGNGAAANPAPAGETTSQQ